MAEARAAAARAATLPTGTVTLLFTDIEGSTQHWEGRRAEMPAALRRHDELIRAAVDANGGHVFKTVGDAFCASFARAHQAAEAAADAQRALGAADWSAIGGLKVRMALHSGTTDEREGDYFGPAVNRVARLLAIVNGGQIAVSSAAALLIRDAMPPQMQLLDLGRHRLKDLVEPENVWQLLAPGLAEIFPSLRSLDALPHNLPRQLTALVGRDEVVAEIESLVVEHSLVTLVGAGGIGKTRAALQVGAELLDGTDDGVWFIDLAPLSDPTLVADTIASTLGLREQSERSTPDSLLRYLKPRRALLILDNCEHLIDEVARVSDTILQQCREVRILATSREPLAIEGEHLYRMPALAVPGESDALTAANALQYGAIALFAQRAAASDGRFRLTDESAPIVAEICRRLDGIALAIELAAARVKVLAPRQLAQRLDERFRLLTGGNRTALPRQQTMHALIDWSYDLLSESEQRLFRRVAIFVGGWTLEAAEAVVTGERLDALEVLDLLSSLVEKSLVVPELDASRPRYALLESTRAFALEKLSESGEHSNLARRHAIWAANLADRYVEVAKTTPAEQWVPEFTPDLDNVQAAIEWAFSASEVALAGRIAAKSLGVWRWAARGEAKPRAWLEAVLSKIDVSVEPVVAAYAWMQLASLVDGTRMADAARRALELGVKSGDAYVESESLYRIAFGFMHAGRLDEAEDAITRVVQLCAERGWMRTYQYANALDMRANIASSAGRVDDARRCHAEALSLIVALGDEHQAVMMRGNIAEDEFAAGDTQRALEYAQAAADEARRAKLAIWEGNARTNSAAYQIVLGDLDAAAISAREGLAILVKLQRARHAAIAVGHLATIGALRGNARAAARLRGYVDACYRGDGCERDLTERRTDEILMDALRSSLDAAEIDAFVSEGARMSEAEAVAEALAATT